MIIQCSGCRTKYHYDEARFGSAPVKKIRCTKCPTVFEIRNPSLAAAAPEPRPDEAPSAGAASSDDASLEATVMGSGPRKRQQSAQPAAPSGAEPAAVRTDTVAAARDAREGAVGRRLRLPDADRLSLACIVGPDAGKIFEINKPRVIIGRSNADVLLSDGECSRRHAALEISDEKVLLVDLGSTNGTYVGDRKVQEVALENRAEFDVGSSTLMFIRSRRD